MSPLPQFPFCARYEDLLKKTDEWTEDELRFARDHESDCLAGVHSGAAIEAAMGYAPGSLASWDGLPPFPLRIRPVRAGFPHIWHRETTASGPQAQLPSRREFCVGVLHLTASVAVATALPGMAEAGSWLTSRVHAKRQEILDRQQPVDRLEWLAEMLRPLGDIAYEAGNKSDHLYLGQTLQEHKESGFPHDRAAVAAFAALDRAARPRALQGRSERTPIRSNQSIVAAGSPRSNKEAVRYLPHYDLIEYGNDRLVSQTYQPERIPYHLFVSNDKSVRVEAASTGRTEPKPVHCLVDGRSGRTYQPKNYVVGGYLRTDFLVVSRLPRRHHGADVVLVSGAHGAGTEAFSLLLNRDVFSDAQLRELWDAIGGKQHFQFVLKCTDLKVINGVTQATRIELWDDCPPAVINREGLFKDDAPEDA